MEEYEYSKPNFGINCLEFFKHFEKGEKILERGE